MALVDRDFLEDALLAIDPNLDVSEGSVADLYLITPLLDRLGPDVLTTDFVELARSLVQSRFPNLVVEEGTALMDAVIKPMQILLEPLVQQLKTIADSQSLQNWRQMASSEIDALLANLFYTRPEQQRAQGVVRVYFTSPVEVEVGDGDVFLTDGGLQFVPAWPQRVTSAQVALNTEAGLYYAEFNVLAQDVGDEYNVDPGQITSVIGIPQAVKVSNPSSMTGGTARVEDAQAISDAQVLISSRDLATADGAMAQLTQTYGGSSRGFQVIGCGDEEMTRDVLTGGRDTFPLAWGADGLVFATTSSTSTSVEWSPYIALAAGLPQVLIDAAGSPTELAKYRLVVDGVECKILSVNTAHNYIEVDQTFPMDFSLGTSYEGLSGSSKGAVYAANWDYFYSEDSTTSFLKEPVVPGMLVKISDPTGDIHARITQVGYMEDSYYQRRIRIDRTLPSTVLPGSVDFSVYVGHTWAVYRHQLVFDDLPDPLQDATAEIGAHLGGKVDIYAAGDLQEASSNLLVVSDQLPAATGYDLESASIQCKVSSASADFSTVKPGSTLHIYTGVAAGLYKVYGVEDAHTLILTSNISTPFSGATFRVSDDVDVELTNPKDVKFTGADLVATAGGRYLTTASGLDFAAAGATIGDWVNIPKGYDAAGDYKITDIIGPGNTIVVLADQVPAAYSGGYTVFRGLDAVSAPVVNIKSVEVIDTDGNLQGVTVPYGHPLGGYGESMTNLGLGDSIDTGPLVSKVGLVSAFESAAMTPHIDYVGLATGGTAGGPTVMSVQIDDQTPVDITFYFASTPSTVAAIADKMVSDAPFLGGMLQIKEWHGHTYLTLTSPDHVITVRNVDGLPLIHLGFSTWVAVTSYDNLGFVSYEVTAWDDINTSPLLLNQYIGLRLAARVADADFTQVFGVYDTQSLVGSIRPFGNVLPSGGWFDTTLGYVSTGVVRTYFKDPTVCLLPGPRKRRPSIGGLVMSQVPAVYTSEGGLTFVPDPEIEAPIVPAETTTASPKSGKVDHTLANRLYTENTVGSGVISNRGDEVDFNVWEVKVGDVLRITTSPIVGTVDLSTFPSGLPGKSMDIAIDTRKVTVYFDAEDDTPDKVAEKINASCGEELSWVYDNGSGNKYLVFESDNDVTVFVSAGDAAAAIFNATPGPYNNDAVDQGGASISGDYRITAINNFGQFVVVGQNIVPGTDDALNFHFRIIRESAQRITPATLRQDDTGLYYADVEVVSTDFGNAYNLEPQNYTITGDETMGWTLSTSVPGVSYSDREELWMRLSLAFPNTSGAFNPATGAMQSLSQSYQVTYNRSSLVEEIQAYLSLSSNRVLAADYLARHFMPAFLYLALEYTPGATDRITQELFEDLVTSLAPEEGLSAHDIDELLYKNGARGATHPIEMVSLWWDEDRQIRFLKSVDKINPTRRSILYLADLVLTRK